MKIHPYLLCCLLAGFIAQLSAQCPPPGFPQPGASCAQAPVLCGSLDGYCGTLDDTNVTKAFPGCPAWVLNNDEWLAFFAAGTSISIQITPSNCIPKNNMVGMQGGIYAACGPPWTPIDLQCVCTQNPFILESSNFVVGNLYYLVLDGCTGTPCDYSIQVLSGLVMAVPPDDPGPISGPSGVCVDSSSVFGINPVAGATMYDWTLQPPGAGTISGAGHTTTISWTDTITGPVELCVTVSNECYSNLVPSCHTIEIVSGPPDIVRAAPKVLLQGPYVSAAQLMHDSLRVQDLVPLTEPYTGLTSFTHTGGGGGEQTTPAVLDVTGSDAIVDWVFLELRSSVDSTFVVATRSALLQRDGDVVDVDGVSPVAFGVAAGENYYLTVRHRNHLGVQLGAAVAYTPCDVPPTDFTALPPQDFFDYNGLNPAQKLISGKYTLWAGNGRIDYQLKYNGSVNDRNAVLSVVGLTTPNAVVPGYLPEDYNMDGVVKYNGSANDRNVLLGNVGITTPSAVVWDQVAR